MRLRVGLISVFCGVVFGGSLACQKPARADDFWSVWGDGKAEVAGYRLSQPRYGQVRKGQAVLIFVTEDFSHSARVKADPGKHDKNDVYPVLKLNAVRKFQTGIYDYSVMTSVFGRLDRDGAGRRMPPTKISFSSQEWCGHVYHQLIFGEGAAKSTSHSYFDGEADDTREIPFPKDAVSEDELPLFLRTYAGKGDLLRPGQTLEVPFLPSLLRTRLLHKPLALGKAVITRLAKAQDEAIAYEVKGPSGEVMSYWFAKAAPHSLLRWRIQGGPLDGEEGTLTGVKRLPYWQLNGKGQESYLKEIGITSPVQ